MFSLQSIVIKLQIINVIETLKENFYWGLYGF